MNRRSQVLLAFVSAVIAGCLWIVFATPPVSKLDAVVGPEAALEGVASKTERLDELPTPVVATNDEGDTKPARVVVPSAPEVSSFAVPDDARWIEGRVIFPDGTPLNEELTVEARGRRYGKDLGYSRSHEAKVASDGTFRVAFSEPTRFGFLSLTGQYLYLPDDVRVELLEQEGELTLKPLLGGRIVGQVHLPVDVSPTADNYASVRVTAWAQDLDSSMPKVTAIQADGSFVIAAIPASGKYRVTGESTRFAQSKLTEQVVRRGEDLVLDMHLMRGVRLSGHVLSKDGAPLANTILTLDRSSTSGIQFYSFPRPQFTVDTEGHFDMAGITPGIIRLTATAQGAQELSLELGDLKDGDTRLDLKLVPLTGHLLSGIVLWPEGSPVADAEVRVRQTSLADEFGREFRDFSCETDANGRFRIDGLTESALVLEASALRAVDAKESTSPRPNKQRLIRRIEDAQPGMTGLRIVLSEGEVLTGFVVDDLGHVVKDFSVQAIPMPENEDRFNELENSIYLGFRSERGEFELTGLTAGKWLVQVKMRRGAFSAFTEVELPHAGPVRLVAPRPASLEGVVRTPDGKPCRGADVSVEYPHSTRMASEVMSGLKEIRTNARGEFKLSGVRPGELHLIAKATGWAPSAKLGLTLLPGEQRTGLELTMRTAGTIAGVVHSDAAPIEGRIIFCLGSEHGDQKESDANGAFRFEGLPTGTFKVTLNLPQVVGDLPETQPQSTRNTVEVEVHEGETVHVVLGGPP